MKKTLSIILAVVLVCMFSTTSFAAAPEEVVVDGSGFVDILQDQDGRARANVAPPATKVITLPYTASADFGNYVFTNYCVKPNSSMLKIAFSGSVNNDTAGKTRVDIWVINQNTKQVVAQRQTSQGYEFNNNWTITGLTKGAPYCVRVSLYDKTNSECRINFTMTLRNA